MAGDMEVPEGPVTVMFTDIEGSTAIRTTTGDAAADELFRTHDDLIRAQIEANRGHDLQAALGDGFLAVFVSTRHAACAIGIQQELEKLNRGRSGPPLRVRIGLNTGEVAWHEGQLSGEAVHAAARVCASAAGGEVFVSDITRQLSGTIPDVGFDDRGEFELKGFPTAWRLWSVSWRATSTEPVGEIFVGREPEMAELRRMLRSALDGRGGTVVIGGEPGVGKTTLVKQLIKEAEGLGAIALLGRCYESDGTVPYSPFVEATEQVLRLVPPEWVREDLGESAGEVARMVPGLRLRFPDIGEPLDLPPEQQRRYFFNAISDFLARGTARLPVVLVVDDIHWADEPTLLLIEHMAEQMKDLRLLAIGTYRDIELDVSRPLAASLERLLRGRLAQRIGLHRFDRDHVARMLSAYAGQPGTDVLIDAVFGETEGNPFFVDEVFRHLVEEGKVYDETGAFRADIELDELDVPESVRLVVGRRIQRLGDDAQRVLAAGAVVGRAFEFELLERITDVDASTLLDIVEEAERARVIVPEEQAGIVSYTFGHELIRQTLLGSLSAPRRQRLHLAVADAMEAIDPDASSFRPSELAHHLVQAGAAADRTRTLDALLRSANRALEAAAFEEARSAAEEALTYLGDGHDDRTHVGLVANLGMAERALGSFERGIVLLNEAADGYARLGDVDAAEPHTYWEVGYIQIWLTNFPEAYTAYQQGIALLDDALPATRALLLAADLVFMGFAVGVDLGDGFLAAEAAAEESGDERAMGRVRWSECIVTWSQCRPEPAIEAGLAAIDHMRSSGDMWALADALPWVSFPLTVTGRFEEAQRYAAEGVEISERVGHQQATALAYRALNIAQLHETPTIDRMLAVADEDRRLLEAVQSPWASQSYGWKAIGLTLAGRLDEGLREADAVPETPSSWLGFTSGYRFVNRVLAGDRDECRRQLDERLAVVQDGSIMTAGRLGEISGLVEGCALLGWHAEADTLVPLMEPWAEITLLRVYDGGSYARIAGMAATAAERWDDAARWFELALSHIDMYKVSLDAPSIRHRYAEMLARRGDPADRARAIGLATEAVDGYRDIGIAVYLPDAERLALSLR